MASFASVSCWWVSAALLFVLCCCYCCCTASLALSHSTVNTSLLSRADILTLLAPLSPRPLPSSATTTSHAFTSISAVTVASPTISSVSGCLLNVAGVTRGCNMSSYITITGSDFVFAGSDRSMLVIDNRVNCSLFSRNFLSSSLIVASLCAYYYPTNVSMSLAVQLGSTLTAAIPAALTFTNNAPIITSVTGCNIGPYNSCNNAQPNRLTIHGYNFLSTPAYPHLFVILDRLLPCTTLPSTITYNRYECVLSSFVWTQVPPASMTFSVVAWVLYPNWVDEVLESVLNDAISFVQLPVSPVSSSSSSSSSGGGGVSRTVPFVRRVSGCVDEGDWTLECPVQTSIDLTIYGLNFQRAALTITIGDDDTAIGAACSTIRVSTDEQLRCTFDTEHVRMWQRALLDVRVNSSLGSSTFPTSIAVSDMVVPPFITAVSGCSDGSGQTRDCTLMSEVRLAGSHFPRWLAPSLIIAGQLELPCQWKSSEVWVSCLLDDHRVDELPKGQLLPIQVRFGNRLSDSVNALAMRNSPPPPPLPSSSTGRPADVIVSDDLQSVKVTLFVLSVLALVAILAGIGVWSVGLWSAHRRAFVSANGQAAVDMRHVLLH